jgi:hypothetical protein
MQYAGGPAPPSVTPHHQDHGHELAGSCAHSAHHQDQGTRPGPAPPRWGWCMYSSFAIPGGNDAGDPSGVYVGYGLR